MIAHMGSWRPTGQKPRLSARLPATTATTSIYAPREQEATVFIGNSRHP